MAQPTVEPLIKKLLISLLLRARVACPFMGDFEIVDADKSARYAIIVIVTPH